MADLLDKLWPAFVSEVTEQLDSVELLLAKNDAAKNMDVNQLFRIFHTIKGSCSMIGFSSMEAIAHKSEDILAAVRNKEISFDEALIDILLESVSCLKKQFHTASQSRKNPKQDDALLERLVRFIESRLDKKPNVEQSINALEQLAQIAKMSVPVMVLGLDPAAKTDAVEKSVSAMAAVAQQCGYRALNSTLHSYVDVISGASENKAELLVEQLAEVFEQLTLITNEQKIDLYLDMGARLCRSKLAAVYSAEMASLDGILNELIGQQPDQWQAEQFLNMVSCCHRLDHFSALFKLQQLQQSWRYIRQLVVEVSRGYLVFSHNIVKQIQTISELAQSKQALAGGDEAFEEQCREAREVLQTITARYNNERDEIVQLKEAIISQTSLCMDSLIDLKMDVLGKIHQAVVDGKLAVEIDIDFTDEIISEKVLKAVRTLGELAHSRTMFHDFVNGVAQRTSFSFLILSQKSLADIVTILSIIDKERKTFTVLEKQNSIVSNDEEPVAQESNVDESDDAGQLATDTALSLNSLKVEGAAIDKVINDIGELVTHQNRLSHLISQDDVSWHVSLLKTLLAHKGEQGRLTAEYFESLFAQLTDANENIHNSISRIQSSVLDLRVVPVSYVFNRFHSFVRTIAQKLNKKVVLEVHGEHVKVDKGMIDVLAEPLAHLVRNSIDHGIESAEIRKASGKSEAGVIRLEAVQHSETVVIEIRDDGAGLDRERILAKCIEKGMLRAGVQYSDQEIFKQIFEPGFSTSQVLTETSGRGVGMDVVKSRMTEVGGSVTVNSEAGKGTVIRLKLPLSAAIQSVILVENQGQTLAVPERYIIEVINVHNQDIQLIQEQSAIMLRNMIVPIYRLSQLLNTGENATEKTQHEVLILASEQATMGLIVDATLGRTEILVRDVHESLRRMPGVSGAAILGDGKVVIILDCAGLFELAMDNAQNILGMTNQYGH